jgi:triacylglycerol lipase
MNVVMVHGFADTGRLFRVLSRELEARGHACHAPTFSPRDGRLGIPDLSGKLASYIADHVPPGAQVALVGFSMGALVSRHYLQALGGARRVRVFFSIAGPHAGTLNAYLYPGEGTRQMRPGSAFLQDLRAGRESLNGMPVYTYRTPMDLMVTPSRSSRIPDAPELVVWSPFHSMLPSNARVVDHIASALAKLEPAAASPVHPG